MNENNLKKELWSMLVAQKDELIGLCSDLLRIPSENPPGHMHAITSYLTAYLEKNGIPFQVVGADAEHPNILAHIGSGKGPEVVFNGHSDVVPAGDRHQWDFDPYGGEIIDGTIRGRGASDMKCGLAASIFAMKLLAERKVPLKGTVVLHVVPDEETGGHLGTKWLVDHGFARNASACIVAEPTSSDNCEVGQRGSLQIRMEITGKSAHGSLGKYKGDNAIRRMMSVFNNLEKLEEMMGRFAPEQIAVLSDSKRIASQVLGVPGIENIIDHVTVNIGIVKGGTKANMVADHCEAEIDIRVPIGLTTQEVLEKFYSIVKETGIKDIRYDVKWNAEANYTDVGEPLVQNVVENARQVWGFPITAAYQWASSDARYYRGAGIPTIQYGPSNTAGIHAYNEDVDIEDVINSAKVYIGTILDLVGVVEN